MNFRGAWTVTTGYAANDAVTFGGSTYLAAMSNSASEPDRYPQAWTVFAQAGSAGPTGPAGTAATVTIGTVTTGAAGSPATVTNVGTASAAILTFTIPQGAAGAPGSGGGGASGSAFASTYHSVQNNLNYPYYSVGNASGSTTEGAPSSVLTWVPAGCTATALKVFSQQGGTITATLRIGTPGNMGSSTDLSCTAATGSSCSATGSDAVPAGGFMDLVLSGANGVAGAVWTAVTCN
jgi:hypothetical protein